MSQDYSEEDFRALCQAVGFTVITWAHIESTLDAIISIAFNNCGGNTIQSQLPRGLKRRIDYIRKCLRKLDTLESYRDDGLMLMQRVSDMKQDRHDLIHGVITSLAHEDGVYVFRRIDAQGSVHHVRPSKFDLKEFPSFAKEISDLGNDLAAFAHQLLAEFVK